MRYLQFTNRSCLNSRYVGFCNGGGYRGTFCCGVTKRCLITHWCECFYRSCSTNSCICNYSSVASFFGHHIAFQQIPKINKNGNKSPEGSKNDNAKGSKYRELLAEKRQINYYNGKTETPGGKVTPETTTRGRTQREERETGKKKGEEAKQRIKKEPRDRSNSKRNRRYVRF
ncbi:hypothetical protein DPMN_027143 [Dreissena polymorpha]|uniref:Uncharacterized protein n=1 Tax=Dreissena polymorpha TaxID=45954 RepID=A0A9D4LUN7_DREPO|nr:hypothetical protein DPMN_027143 [Dreissena polymorpha]